jgi:hypothetical protein
MAFSGNFMCTSFKSELLQAVHNFTNGTGDTFKLALYTNSASFTAATTAYTATNEVVGTGYSCRRRNTYECNPNIFGDHCIHRLCRPDVQHCNDHRPWRNDLQ